MTRRLVVAALAGAGTLGVAAVVRARQRPSEDLTIAELRAIMPACPAERAAEHLPHINAAMRECGILTTRARIAAYVAQLAHESGQLRYMNELGHSAAVKGCKLCASGGAPHPAGAQYEGRQDLGNRTAGDGVRYRGRGPIQLTGRANYSSAGAALGLALEAAPDQVATPAVGHRTSAWFWDVHDLSALADAGRFVDLTRAINGGTNGLADREKYFKRAQEILAQRGKA